MVHFMDDVQPIGVDIDWIVEVVNELSAPTRRAAGESDHELAVPSGAPSISQQLTVPELVAITNSWFEVFTADNIGRVAELLNSFIAAAPTVTTVVEVDGALAVVELYSNSVPASDQLLAAGARALAATVSEIGSDRIGVCSASRCLDVFVDRSPKRNRRYCSQLCQTRERVQRYRSQHSTG